MLQPFTVADATLQWFRRYVRASFPLRDPGLDKARERLIDKGLLWANPHVALARPGSPGPKLAEMSRLLDPATLAIPWGFDRLYEHQHRAIERLTARPGHHPRSTLVLSGTGSGKTEAFLIPVVDACLRDPSPGIKAVVVYPMNALANDQLNRLRQLLAGTPVTFGRYTGDAPETDVGDSRRPGRPDEAPENLRWSRKAMRERPPHILLTNYTMLEYLLLRGKDEELFQHGPPRYLIVDEIHLFSGVLGAEVGALLRRFRQHTDPGGGGICMVGTSATAGSDTETDELRHFAERFFGAPFDPEALIAETPAPFADSGPTVPGPPTLTPELLRAATDVPGLAALAKATFGVDLPADTRFAEQLGAVIDRYATVSVVERALARPASLGAAAQALADLPQRSGVSEDARLLEAQAVVLLGAAARVPAVGEDEPQPRFRPRVHQVLRSLAGLWRCTDPAHGELRPPDGGRCSCGAFTLPLASCRTCGEAYWSSPAPTRDLDAITRVVAVEYERGGPAVFLADPARLTDLVGTDLVGEDEDGNKFVWQEARLCPRCGGFATGTRAVAHARNCPRPDVDGVAVLASDDDIHCPACRSQGARNRPILLALKGSAAASVAVVTNGLSDELRNHTAEAGGRLLVFADSRQNAAQQAGYSDDQGARVAIRQLIAASVVQTGRLTLPATSSRVAAQVLDDPTTLRRWLVGEAARDFAEVSDPDYVPSPEDRDRIKRQLDWEVALEVTERARRRFSLEQEGVVVVTIDELDQLAAKVAETWPGNPFGDLQLRDVVAAVADVLRYGRAVSQWLLVRDPRALVRNHGIRIGDFAVTSTRGYADKKYRSQRDGIDIRAWADARYTTRLTELIGRVLDKKPTEVAEIVETLASRLQATGLLTNHKVGGRNRWMLDHNRVLIVSRTDQRLWRCDRCGTVRAALLANVDGKALCANWHCPGTPQPFDPPAERDFYRGQYQARPRRVIVREHSGQIPGETRLALEAAFNNRDLPLVDALACTPTLEVGVSLDDLHATILRNLPPSPANYAQRVGRAGRRSKVALAVAHAGHGPHDTYYFERPEEMIAGEVRAPAISLDNPPLLRRHVNSLVFEVLGLDLPRRWVPAPDGSTPPEEATIADADGVLRESAIKPLADQLADPAVRARVEDAVRGAFASTMDPAPPTGVETFCLAQVGRFVDELREALNRWCGRYRSLVEEYKKAQAAPGIPSPTDKAFQDRLYREIVRLAQPSSPEYQPLGFLGLVGFLPRYGFTADSVLLHVAGSDEPIVQAAPVAVTEFAPGNVVYARGRRLKVRRLDPAPVEEASAGPEHRDNVLSQGRRCDACEYFTTNLLEKACPSCGADLVAQAVLSLTGVYASGGAISSEDEYRRRSGYQLRHLLGPGQDPSAVVELGGLHIENSRGRAITVANIGPRRDDEAAKARFELCTGCGYAAESSDPEDDPDTEEAEPTGHKPYCPARKDPKSELVKRGVWLTARLQGDVMEILLPHATRSASYESWRVTLAEALLLGIRETMQASRGDLDWFERHQNDEPISLVLYDTMPGGTGYIPKLFTDGAAGFKAAALEAGRRLGGCTCPDSCHRCLRDFWNQRNHHALNRFEVLAILQRLAGAAVVEGLDPEDDKLESFLEQEFFTRLQAAGLALPTLQVVRVIGGRRIIRVDCEYRDPDVSIFLDGRAWHAQSVEKVIDDLEIRNALEAKGTCVLEYTYRDVIDDFDRVAQEVRTALDGGTDDPTLDLGSLPGWSLKDSDTRRKQAVVAVEPAAWVASESSRLTSLRSGNRARLAGWRLRRTYN
jgi:replicative superfamily II helicase